MAGANVALVALSRAHLALTREWANDAEIARVMDRARPVGEAEHEAWFEALGRRDDCAYFAVETVPDRRHVGNVWLWAIDTRHRKAELRIVIGSADARGHGIGRAAIDRACELGFERFNLHRVYAYVLSINPAARRAFERAGFVLEGTLHDDRWSGDRFVDTWLLARTAPR